MIEPSMRYYWVKEFSGLLDGIHKIEMVLVTDNIEFRGVCRYISSGEKYLLYGDMREGQIHLNEYDYDNRITGIIQGSISGDYFYGEWKNKADSETLPILMKAGKGNLSDCSESYNYIRYQVKIDKDLYQISWIKEKGEYALWITDNNAANRQEIECDFQDCQATTIQVVDKVLTILPGLNELNFYLHDNKSYKPIAPIKTWNIGYQCTEYIDFDERLVEVKPGVVNKAFNNYLHSLMSDKTAFIIDRLKKAKKEKEHQPVEERLQTGSFSEAIVSFYNGKIISGVIKIHCSYYREFTEIPFAFDLANGKEFEITDFFIDNKLALKYLADHYEQHLNDNYGEEYVQWCSESGISGFYISDKGLHLRTIASPIFGNCETVIPINQLKTDNLTNTGFAKIMNIK